MLILVNVPAASSPTDHVTCKQATEAGKHARDNFPRGPDSFSVFVWLSPGLYLIIQLLTIGLDGAASSAARTLNRRGRCLTLRYVTSKKFEWRYIPMLGVYQFDIPAKYSFGSIAAISWFTCDLPLSTEAN